MKNASDTENAKCILARVKRHQSTNSSRSFQDLFNDIQLSSQNSPSIVAFKIKLVQISQINLQSQVQCFSGSLFIASVEQAGRFFAVTLFSLL